VTPAPPRPAAEPAEHRAVRHQRWRLMCQIHDRAEKPLALLAIALAFLLASYAFTFLGYTAAAIASHFVGEDASQRGEAPARAADVTDTAT
jgi:hypothetical protein